MKGGSRERKTHVHAHSYAKAQRGSERHTRERRTPSEKCGALGRGRKSDRERIRDGLLERQTMKETNQGGKERLNF